MRIVYLHQFFVTRAGVGGTRSYEFARRFVALGHEVRIVTAAGAAGPGTRRVDGIEVVAVRGAYSDYVQATSLSYPRRMLAFARFALSATATALRGPRPDVVYATSPPLTMALPALAVAAVRRVPLVWEVRDLWPEAPIQMGALRNPVLRRAARALERFVYRRAARLIALSPGSRAGMIAAGASTERVALVPNASDLDLFRPADLPERFRVSCFGTMGEANDLTAAVEAARLLPEVEFLLVGDGKRRAELERWAPPNVRFTGPASGKEEVAELAAGSSACLTLFKDLPVLATNSPNKLFDTFAAGRPAIVNMDGWMRQLVEENEAGLYVRAGDARGLADGIGWLRDHPVEAERMGRNARALAEREFDRDELAAQALRVLEGGRPLSVELSYCVVNTNGREDLVACLDAIGRTHPAEVEHELLVLDNASDDGSAEAVRERFPQARLFALERRMGKAANDSMLLREARGRYCLLLNEDAELREGAARGLVEALERDPGAAAAGAQLLTGAGEPTACAWRLPDAGWALAAAVFLHDRYAVQSTGTAVRQVGWVQSSAMLVRRDAAERVGWLDRDFFVYSDETDFCKRLHDAGWRILFVPQAQAIHHDQLSTDAAAMRRRIVEFHRNRDLYFVKHDMPVTRVLWRLCWTWAYLVRAAAAVALPDHDPRRYLIHARQQLMPSVGEGIREAADAYNARRGGLRRD